MIWIPKGAADQSVIDFIETNGMEDRVVIDDTSIEWPETPVRFKTNARAPSATISALGKPNSGKAPASAIADGGPCGAVSMLRGITESLKLAGKSKSNPSRLRRGAIGGKSMNSGTDPEPTVDKEMPGMA